MLVPSRKEDEEVVLGNNIWLTVVAIRGNQGRLGVTTPPDVSIQQAELCPEAEPCLVTPPQPLISCRDWLRWNNWRLRCSPG
jgi:carbon storage regulator CsrA